MLLTNTESKSIITFLIKSLIQDKSKSTGRNCWRFTPEYRLGLLHNLAIIECPNCPTVLNLLVLKLTGIDKKDESETLLDWTNIVILNE